MSVTRRDVEYIAGLARLRLDDGDLESMTRDLNAILEHADTLAAADDESAPTYEVAPPAAPTREPGAVDVHSLERPPSAFAPEWTDGFFTVPRLAAMDDS